MAKGQKRSNREIRKPKANKPAVAAEAGASPFVKGTLAPAATPRNKKKS
jgi:hypothetical protein